jgi:hypothetical protein
MGIQSRTYANRLLDGSNTFVTGATPVAKLRQLMAALSPVASDKPLLRLGPAGDGGYLVPDDLDAIEACFSPGVSLLSGFEADCVRRGMAAFLADASVAGPAQPDPGFVFTRKFVGVTSSDAFMTMDDWVSHSLPGKQSDLLLQMDIEGCEYEVLLGMSDALLRRFRIVVVEFHDLEELWNRPWFKLASRAFEKVLQGHACVHIHPNNCHGLFRRRGLEIPRTAEFTFLRRDRVAGARPARVFPHPLDRDNTDNPPVALPDCWINARP